MNHFAGSELEVLPVYDIVGGPGTDGFSTKEFIRGLFLPVFHRFSVARIVRFQDNGCINLKQNMRIHCRCVCSIGESWKLSGNFIYTKESHLSIQLLTRNRKTGYRLRYKFLAQYRQ